MGIRVGVISDLHTDYNRVYKVTDNLIKICQEKGINTLLIAGDISSSYENTIGVINKLKKNGIVAWWVPGNHEFFVGGKYNDSMVLYNKYKEHEHCLIDKIIKIGDSIIIGNVGWYDYSFRSFQQYTLAQTKTKQGWADKNRVTFDDFSFCRMQNDYFIGKLEEIRKNGYDDKVIVVSHMLGFIENVRKYPSTFFDAYVGNIEFGNILQQYKVNMHIFGHSHIPMCGKIENVKFMSSELGYDFEWKGMNIVERLNNCLQIIEA